MASTRWIDHLTPLDAEVDGRQQPIYVTTSFDGNVGIDVSADVAAGGVLASIATTMRRLPTDLETDYVDASDLITGLPTSAGDVVLQRLAGPWRADRCYRLQADFGPPGNRRSSSVMVCCVEGGVSP